MGAIDLSFKALLDRLPYQTIRQFGARRIRRDAVIEMPQREVSLPLKAVDGACVLHLDGETWVEHFESEVGLSGEDIEQIRRRAQALDLKHDAAVFTTILLMAERRSPQCPPELLSIERGTLTLQVKPRYIRLWKEAPDELLEGAPVEAAPWIAAMNATPEQEEWMIRTILEIRDKEKRDRLAAEAVTLAGLKYDKDKVAEFRQRFLMVTTKDLMRASVVGEELIEEGFERGVEKGLEQGIEQGIEKGIQQGLERGRLEAAERISRHIRSLVADRIPGGVEIDWLGSVADPDRLDRLFDELFAARDESGALAILERFRG